MGEAVTGDAQAPLPGHEPSFEYLREWQKETFGKRAIVPTFSEPATSKDKVNEAYLVGCWNGYMRGVADTSESMHKDAMTTVSQGFFSGFGLGVVAACIVFALIRAFWRRKPAV